MTKAELINSVALKTGLSVSDLRNVYRATINAISDTLEKGERVVIRNVGTFSTVNRAQRIARNPQTGKEIKIAPKKVVKFKPNCPGPH